MGDEVQRTRHFNGRLKGAYMPPHKVKPQRPEDKEDEPELSQDQIIRRLGYEPGLPRSMKPDSMWPIHSSDLHDVIANMKAKSVASPPGTGNANSPVAKVDSPQEKKAVTFTKLKDVYVLKFPEDGTRLIAH